MDALGVRRKRTPAGPRMRVVGHLRTHYDDGDRLDLKLECGHHKVRDCGRGKPAPRTAECAECARRA